MADPPDYLRTEEAGHMRQLREMRRNEAAGIIYANSEPQLNAKYSCAASVAIAR